MLKAVIFETEMYAVKSWLKTSKERMDGSQRNFYVNSHIKVCLGVEFMVC